MNSGTRITQQQQQKRNEIKAKIKSKVFIVFRYSSVRPVKYLMYRKISRKKRAERGANILGAKNQFSCLQ